MKSTRSKTKAKEIKTPEINPEWVEHLSPASGSRDKRVAKDFQNEEPSNIRSKKKSSKANKKQGEGKEADQPKANRASKSPSLIATAQKPSPYKMIDENNEKTEKVQTVPSKEMQVEEREKKQDKMEDENEEKREVQQQPQLHPQVAPELLPRRQKISPKNRWKLFQWISGQFDRRKITREAIAHCFNLFDRVLEVVNSCEGNEFQNYALASMYLALKFQNCPPKIPMISGELSQSEVVKYEQKICCILKYKVSFTTYIPYFNDLAMNWDVYAHGKGKEHLVIGFCDEKSRVAIKFYERLECINLVNFDHRLRDLDICFNLLFLEVYMKFMRMQNNPVWNSNPAFFMLDAYRNQELLDLFREFSKTLDIELKAAQLKIIIGEFICPFLKLKIQTFIGSKDQSFSKNCLNYHLNPYVYLQSKEILQSMDRWQK